MITEKKATQEEAPISNIPFWEVALLKAGIDPKTVDEYNIP